MWFPSTTASLNAQPTRQPTCRAKRSADRRQQARRLFLEGLEVRSLMAFNVLAEYATDFNPQDLALTQIDAGSQLDLVVANLGSNSIDVRLGNADGSFGSAQTSPTGTGPRSVATGDFTGDGNTDVLTANSADVSLLTGNGDGTFQPPLSILLPGQFPPGYTGTEERPQTALSIATGDLDADGKLDIVVGTDTYFTQKSCYTGYYGGYYCNYFNTYDGYVNVLLGNGTGGFGPAETHHLGTNRFPNAVAVGNINGDTNADVITANGYDLSVLLGDGTGAVGSPNHTGSGSALRSISLGDVDGDGKVDTLLTSGSGLYVQKGDGLGGFTAQPHLSTGIAVNSAVMGDVNADGTLDLVGAGATNAFTCTSYGYWGCYDGYNTTTRQASVLLGNGLGSFALPLTSSLGSELGYGFLADVSVADLTGDGLPELATIDYYASKAIVATNDGDWDPPPSIVISDAAIVIEGDSGAVNAVFTVTIVGDHDGVSVDYATGDDTAAAGSDFTSQSGTLTFGLGETSQTISVPILGDTLDEYDEQFLVNLSNALSGEITDSQGIGTIEDDDAAPLVTINNVSKNEGQRRQNTSFEFTVSLSEASGKWVYVNFATADGSATVAGSDYFDASGTVYIAPGQTTGTLYVTVRGDKSREPNETFAVNLTSATDGTISDDQGIATIVNDDGGRTSSPPKLKIGDASVKEGSSGVKLLVFIVTLTEASEELVSVAYATKDGRAKASDDDYVPIFGRVDFAPGERTKTICVTINGDLKREDDESFYVDLSDAQGAEIGESRGRGRILNDDRRSSGHDDD